MLRELAIALTTAGMLAGPAGASDLSEPGGKMTSDRPAISWTGLYIGAHGGYLDGGFNGELVYDAGKGPVNGVWSEPEQSLEGEGWVGGVQVGYNQQINRLVFGMEADYSWTDFEETGSFLTKSKAVEWTITDRINGFGSVRGRLGLALDRVLLYGTGGVAIADTSSDLTVVHTGPAPACCPGGVTARGSADEWHVGWVAGAGAEYMITPRITLRAEWLHYDLGSADYRLVGTNYISNPDSAHTTDAFPSDLQFDVFRAGVNVKLGDGPLNLE
jgi:outer membrane immunogenic protein